MTDQRYYSQCGLYGETTVSITMGGPQSAEHVCEHVRAILDKPHVLRVIVIRSDQVTEGSGREYCSIYEKIQEHPHA